jgi:hypothetical protein
MSVSTRSIVLALEVGESALFEATSNMQHTLTTHAMRAGFKATVNKLQAIHNDEILTLFKITRTK